jgi:hypothetical protein
LCSMLKWKGAARAVQMLTPKQHGGCVVTDTPVTLPASLQQGVTWLWLWLGPHGSARHKQQQQQEPPSWVADGALTGAPADASCCCCCLRCCWCWLRCCWPHCQHCLSCCCCCCRCYCLRLLWDWLGLTPMQHLQGLAGRQPAQTQPPATW